MQFLQNTIDFCVAGGEEIDHIAKEESVKSSKEELMKLFAVSNFRLFFISVSFYSKNISVVFLKKLV